MWRWIGLLLVLLMMVPGVEAQRRGGGGRGSRSSSSQRPRTPPPPTTKPSPPVVITKTDNTVLRGTILSATPDEVFFQPAPKPGAPAQTSADDFITIEWKDILRISNGLTRQKALDEWKQQHKDELCLTCLGDRVVWCTVCKGTGHDPASGADCPRCKGALTIDCTNPKCKDGKIPCPATCLKLTEGTWYTKPDGSKWRKFPVGNSFREFSDKHLGNLIVHEGNDWVDKGKCPTCGGATQLTCPTCRGNDKIPCPTCLARKDAPDCPNQDCEKGQVECPTCKGSGLKTGATPTPTASLLYDIDSQG